LRLDQAHESSIRALRGSQIGVVFQEPMTSLNPLQSVGAQLAEAARLHLPLSHREIRDHCAAAIARVGISETRLNSYPHELSGGMRQRVMIAMALMGRPRLLIADEPTTALDATVQRQILMLLDGVRREQGLSMLLVTHDMGVVAQVADDVCLMHAGRILERGPCRTLLSNPTHPYARGLLKSVPALGRRVARLSTVFDTLGDPREIQRFRERTGHSPFCIPGMTPHPDHGTGWRLVPVRESHPDHWVAVTSDSQASSADTSS
jgi:peptide/nickel transport system ATP-binding protein